MASFRSLFAGLSKDGVNHLGTITVRGKDTQQISDVQLAAETKLNVSIWALDVSKSGILCGCDDGAIHLLNTELLPIKTYNLAHRGPVTYLLWHTDGIHFLSVGLDRCVRVWSLSFLNDKSNAPLLSVPHSCAVTAACFAPRAVSIDDSAPSSVWMFSAGTDGRLRAWRGPLLDQYESVAPAGGGSDRQPSALAARLDGSAALVAVGGQSGHLLIMRFVDGQFLLRAQMHCKNRSGKHSNGERIVSVCWTAPDELLVSTHDDRLRLLRYRERELIPIGKFKGHQSNSKSPLGAYLIRPREGLASDDESYLISGSECGHVFIWRRDATAVDSTGEVDTAASFESFLAVEKPDRLTACVPAPWEPERIDSQARLPACSVVATLQGVVRIFYNRGSPISLR